MLAQPSIIKRPVVNLGDRLLAGFKPDIYAEVFDLGGGLRMLRSAATSSSAHLAGT